MPFKETMYNKQGEIIDACPFIFNIDLEDLETHYCATLLIKPLDPCVIITSKYYEFSETETDFSSGFDRIKSFDTTFFYDDENDKLVLNVFNGFDVALFNICSLLGIGRFTLRDEVPFDENGFAPIHDKVGELIFTLEEFKQLDGHVVWLKFTKHFVLFKGLLVGANYIHESVKDGDVVPNFKSSVLKRGERLFLID